MDENKLSSSEDRGKSKRVGFDSGYDSSSDDRLKEAFKEYFKKAAKIAREKK